jgi:hypothetical protein
MEHAISLSPDRQYARIVIKSNKRLFGKPFKSKMTMVYQVRDKYAIKCAEKQWMEIGSNLREAEMLTDA